MSNENIRTQFCASRGYLAIILQILFATRADLKILAYSQVFLSFSWRILIGHITRLDQWRASKKDI